MIVALCFSSKAPREMYLRAKKNGSIGLLPLPLQGLACD